ncbi:MAG: Fe(3+) ABC transporter substrate-binding protein [Rhodovibrionaceae bacterium]
MLNSLSRRCMTAVAAAAILVGASAYGQPAHADGEVNLYSSRHYDTDERLYSDFEEQTGITVNRIEDDGSVLIERIKSEGENSPADIFLTTDAGRLWAAEQEALFQPVDSSLLEERVPAHLQHPDNLWFGFSQRARVIFYDKERVDPSELTSYQDLADPKWEGMICTRTSSNIYMLSLMAAMIEHLGEDGAKEWAAGLWSNRARDPEGGDTDQLRGIASGQCAIAVANTYYFARALRTDVKDLTGKTDGIGVIFPNQDGTGTHVNISGGGVLKHAPNRENAVKFLEYLASDQAQEYFAAGNDEYPVVEDAAMPSTVASLGDFKSDDLNLSVLGKNQAKAQEIYNEVGYK